MRRAAKIDSNQNEIVEALRKIPNLTVAITSAVGKGYPDLNIGYKGKNYLIEIKDGNKPKSQQKLTPDEEKWHRNWNGQVATCSSIDEILELLTIKNKN
jgi:hypothetical protein